jgi:hypothetical protein
MVDEGNPDIWKRRTAGLLELAGQNMKTMKGSMVLAAIG